MKKIYPLVCGVALLCAAAACQSADEQAAPRLRLAEQAFEQKNYARAKIEADSIKILYPKAFDTRRAALRLLRRVELAEQQATVAYCDSVLAQARAAATALADGLLLERDTAYQQVGNYFAPAQQLERRMGHTFLRAQVSESGQMSLTSVYNGAALGHNAVRVSLGELFVETPASSNPYVSQNLGVVTEKVDFVQGADGGLVEFIASHADAKNLRVELLGGRRKLSYTLLERDAQAFASLLRLAQALQAVASAEAIRAEAERHIAFVERGISKEERGEE